jgi:hypothetical protein
LSVCVGRKWFARVGAFEAIDGTVANPRATHRRRSDAGHDLTLGQMSVAHQSSVAIIGQLVGMAAEEAGNLGLHRMRQQRSRAGA